MCESSLVSVIVPNYNHAKYLKQRLESIFSQTYKNFEVIILDDCSTDNSRGVIMEYRLHPKVAKIDFNQKNSGSPFKQWNKGIQLAQGKYVWIAESDDYCDKNFLSTLLESHGNNTDIALVYSQSYRVNSEGEVKGTWLNHTAQLNPVQFKGDFVMEGNSFIEKYLVHKNVIPNVSGVLFEKKSLKKIFPLKMESYLKYNADWFYYIQLLCNSKVAFNSKPLNYFRFHPKSVIATAGSASGWLKIFRMELRARKEMISYLEGCNPSNMDKIREQSRLGNNQIYFSMAKGYLKAGNIFKALQVIGGNPSILKKIINFYYKKHL